MPERLNAFSAIRPFDIWVLVLQQASITYTRLRCISPRGGRSFQVPRSVVGFSTHPVQNIHTYIGDCTHVYVDKMSGIIDLDLTPTIRCDEIFSVNF